MLDYTERPQSVLEGNCSAIVEKFSETTVQVLPQYLREFYIERGVAQFAKYS